MKTLDSKAWELPGHGSYLSARRVVYSGSEGTKLLHLGPFQTMYLFIWLLLRILFNDELLILTVLS